MRALAVALVLPLALSGCFTELLGGELASTRSFACGFLTEDHVAIVVHVSPDVAYDPSVPVAVLHQQLLRVREAPVARHVDDGPPVPDEGWTRDALAAWADELDPFDPWALHVLWTTDLPGVTPSGLVVAPGVIAIGQDEVLAGNQSTDEDATAVLLHNAGHALGAVNRGIPVQDADLAKREGPPGHDPDPGSPLSASWHQAATMPGNGSAWPDALVHDWQAAIGPDGVCP